jgi:SAM-dependent methyltransferase
MAEVSAALLLPANQNGLRLSVPCYGSSRTREILVAMESSLAESRYHDTRFTYDRRREIVWQVLCAEFFQPLIQPQFHVLDLGSGYGHFINNVRCASKTAIDQWPGLREHAAPDVKTHIGSVSDLHFLADGSVDFAFASNLFEHLTQDQFAQTLAEVRRVLRPGGTLNILQPNYRLAYREYFDDYTHVAIYSDRSLADFLEAHEFRVLQAIPGFLPFSVKSSGGAVRPWIIRTYLRSPWKPLAKQMFVRAAVGS